MDLSLSDLGALIGQTLDSPRVVEFFLTQPATARRRREGQTDLKGIRSLSSKELGYEVDFRKGRIETIFVYVSAHHGYAAFQGELVAGLTIHDTPEDVRRKLGPATHSGVSDPEGLWPWDRFDSETLCLHISYEESGVGLRRLTLMAPDVAP